MSNKSIAFQGVPGAYSEAAAYEFLGSGIQTLPCQTFEAVFEAVASDPDVDGLVPIENSLDGSIHRNYDLLLERGLPIVGEYPFRVSHCLMALPGVRLEEIKTAHSHPQALGQCRKQLAALGLQVVAEYDTAGSARMIAEKGLRNAAALASKRAAEVYGLEILAEGLEDHPANFTRFLQIASTPVPKPAGKSKISIAFALDNRPGALNEALGIFAGRGIDLTKIESRPLPGAPWEYIFYIDLTGHPEDPACREALGELEAYALSVHLLGAYPAEPGRQSGLAPGFRNP